MNQQRAWVSASVVMALVIYAVGTATMSQSAVPDPGFSGFATATPIHVTALQGGATGPRLVDTEVAFSASATDTEGWGDPSDLQNEMQVALLPSTVTPPPVRQSAGRGSGLEVGINNDLPTEARDVAQAGESASVAPPSSANTTEIGPAPVNPLAWASLLRGESEANFDDNPCRFDRDNPLGMGLGYAADAQLLDAGQGPAPDPMVNPVLATDDDDPERGVTQSVSRTWAVPNSTPGRYGLVSETRTTFAPISIDRGTPLPTPDIVIELLGEWVFRATATGETGGASIEYTVENMPDPGPVTPTTVIVRVSLDGGTTYQGLTFQQLFTDEGLAITELEPLLSIGIGEDPRAIARPAGTLPDPLSDPTVAPDGTVAEAAVDVVRLALLHGDPVPAGSNAADLRIGHFEASVTVPTNGFTCDTPDTTTTTTTSTSTTSTSTTSTSTSTTTTAATAVLEICNRTNDHHGPITGNFTYFFNGRTVTAPAGGCSGPLTVPARQTTVVQGDRPGIRVNDCDTSPANRLVRCEPAQRRATTRVVAGGVRNETVLTFVNVVEDNNVARIKVCKIAGNGVAVGTVFNFTVGNRTTSVAAGPANQGGYCKLLHGFPVGENVTITEAAKPGTRVSAISVEPAADRVSSNNAQRRATIRGTRNITIVSFTNAAT